MHTDGPVELPVEDLDWPDGNREVVARWHTPTTVSVPGPGGTWQCTRYWKCEQFGLVIAGPNGQKKFGCVKGHWAMDCKLA
jgi:hypothetical protein